MVVAYIVARMIAVEICSPNFWETSFSINMLGPLDNRLTSRATNKKIYTIKLLMPDWKRPLSQYLKRDGSALMLGVCLCF